MERVSDSSLRSTISIATPRGEFLSQRSAKLMLKRRRPIFGIPAWAIHCFVESAPIQIAYVKAEQIQPG